MDIIILDASSTARTKIENLLLEMGVELDDIHQFEDGAEALEYIREYEADLIFSALEMSTMDGVSFTHLLLTEYPHLVSKLFIVSSAKNSEQFEEVKEVGAKRFINKPIDEEYFRHFVTHEISKII